MRQKRSPRIATVCVLGRKATRAAQQNPRRLRLMRHVIEEIVGRPDWHPLDAVLFPGCFLRLDKFIGRLPTDERISEIERQKFAGGVCDAVRLLQTPSSGALIVFGADSTDPESEENGDQFCIAMGSTGVVGLARKIFP